MKLNHIFSGGLALFAMACISSCEKIAIPREEQTDSYNQVYMSAAVRNPGIVTLKMLDSTYAITYGGSYGGVATPAEDIELKFTVDEQKAKEYNESRGTGYPMLPASAYSLSASTAILAKGTLATQPLAVKVNPTKGMDLFKEYLLAVSMSATKEGVKVNESLRTAYFIVKASLDFADFADFDRSGWSVPGVSSEEPAEGEKNGGLGIHAIDNKPSTFWHTQWDPSYSPPPHWIAIDMGTSKVIHGLYFTGRQSTNDGKPNRVLVEVSNNGTDWSPAGTLTLQNTNATQRFFLPEFPQARYMRIVVESNFGNTAYTHLAELGAF